MSAQVAVTFNLKKVEAWFKDLISVLAIFELDLAAVDINLQRFLEHEFALASRFGQEGE